MLVWWHCVQTASTVSLPALCGSAAGRPCSWAWAANGTNAKTAAAIKETVEGPDISNLIPKLACEPQPTRNRPPTIHRHARESGHPVVTALEAAVRQCPTDGSVVTGSAACAGDDSASLAALTSSAASRRCFRRR